MKTIFYIFYIFFFTLNICTAENPKMKSLGVKEAIKIALENNPEILRSGYLKSAAEGRYWKDISLPPMSISLSNEFIPNGLGFSKYDEKTIEVSQDFDFPVTYFKKGARANLEIKNSDAERLNTMNHIKSLVKWNYFNSYAKFKILQIAEENLEIANDFFNKAEIKYKVGEGTNLELLTAKVQLAEAKSFIVLSRREYNTALTQLKYSMGNTEDIDFENINFQDLLSYKKFNFELSNLIEKALTQNPGLKKASFEMEASEISRQISWYNLFPTFSASYMFQTRESFSNYYGVKFGVKIPVWFMFEQKGDIKESGANYQIKTADYQIEKNNLMKNINSDFLDYINDEKQLSLYENEIIPLTEEVFRNAELSYKAGEINYLEFLQAKITTINAKINLIKSLFDYKESIINLEESIGLDLE